MGCLVQLAVALVLVAAIGVPLLLAFFGVEAFKTGRLTDIEQPERFDPIQQFPAISRRVGAGLPLAQIIARSVRADGTVDLTASWRPTVLFQFLAARSGGQLPVGAPGSGGGLRLLTVRADRPGWNATGSDGSGTYYDWSRGLTLLPAIDFPAGVLTPQGPPACSFKVLWEKAIAQGAPAAAVADIHYQRDTYSFTIQGTPHAYRFDRGCTMLR